MQVDRARFLVLTGALAAAHAACAGKPEVDVAAIPAGDVVVAAPPSAGAPAPADAPDAGAPEPEPVETAEPVAAPSEPPPAANEDESATCKNTKGKALTCSLKAPGPVCESFQDTRDQCGKFNRGLQPRVAEKFVGCLNAKSGKPDLCDFDVTNTCFEAARKFACVEPSTTKPCQDAVKACSGMRGSKLTERSCKAFSSSFVAAKRTKIMGCVVESCSVEYCHFAITY